MKRPVALSLLILLLATPSAFAQQEQGDVELQLAGSYTTSVGSEDFSFAFGNFQGKLGYFVTDGLEIGAYPSLSITTSQSGFSASETTTTLGAGVFLVYSVLTGDGTTVPYLGGQYFKADLDNDEDQGHSGINAGVKFFLNR